MDLKEQRGLKASKMECQDAEIYLKYSPKQDKAELGWTFWLLARHMCGL